MRNHVTRWSAAALLLLTLAPIAHAQGTSLGWGQPNRRPQTGTVQVPQIKVGIVGGVSTADTSGVPFTLTTGGALNIAEVSPPMDANLTFAPEQCIAGSSAMSIGGSDSSAVMDTHRMRLGMLLIRGVIGGTGTVDSTCTAVLAVQIRTHLNSSADSSATFAIYQYGVQPSNVATAMAADTSAAGHLFRGSPSEPWSGEQVIAISAGRMAPANSVSIGARVFAYPSGIAIPLSSLFGRDIYSPATSVRVRVLRIQKGSASLTTANVTVQVSLVGTPL